MLGNSLSSLSLPVIELQPHETLANRTDNVVPLRPRKIDRLN